MKKVYSVISALLTGVLLAGVLVLVVPRLFRVQMFSVLSGSMEPAYSVGDLIYVVPTNEDKMKAGDVITFTLAGGDGTVATHRITQVDAANRQFYTKGDANEIGDARPVQYEQVIGTVKLSIPKIGYLIGYMNQTYGKIITITIILALIILIALLQGQTKEEEEKENATKQPLLGKIAAKKKKKRVIDILPHIGESLEPESTASPVQVKEEALKPRPSIPRPSIPKPSIPKPSIPKQSASERQQQVQVRQVQAQPVDETQSALATDPPGKVINYAEYKTPYTAKVTAKQPPKERQSKRAEELQANAQEIERERLQVWYKMLCVMESMITQMAKESDNPFPAKLEIGDKRSNLLEEFTSIDKFAEFTSSKEGRENDESGEDKRAG